MFKLILTYPLRISAVCFLIALCSFTCMYLFWPAFDWDFWIEFYLFFFSLNLSMVLTAYAFFKSKKLWLKAIGIAPATIALLLCTSTVMAYLKLDAAGASIELLSAPENHQSVNNRHIHMVYLHLESTNQQPQNPIVYLAGGPGGSGILTLYLSGRYPVFMAMREIADVIAYDQRGTMPWNDPGLYCPNVWQYPFDAPLSLEKWSAIQSESIQTCAKHFSNVEIEHYNTAQNAADLDLLRQQLGVDKINLWATSYGTHLALAYIKQFPEHVDRIILHGVEGLDQTFKLPSNTQKALLELDKQASSNKAISALMPSLISEIQNIQEQLESSPLTVNIQLDEHLETIVLGKLDFQLYLSHLMTTANSNRSLPQRVYSIKQQRYDHFARWAASMRSNNRENLMAIVSDCSSGATQARLEQIHQEQKHTLLGNAINGTFPGICQSIAYQDLGDQFRKNPKSNRPLLMFSGALDVRTPSSNAKAVQLGFPNSQHIIIKGAGHQSDLFTSSEDIRVAMHNFFDNKPFNKNTYINVPFTFAPFDQQTN